MYIGALTGKLLVPILFTGLSEILGEAYSLDWRVTVQCAGYRAMA